jgi:putative cell wall-binding protein/N-acetylneuraminic acid mutarotase
MTTHSALRRLVPSPLLAIVSALALALGLLAAVPSASAQDTDDDDSVQPARIDGQNRFDTAARIATTTFDTATTAHIVTGQDFPDALAASYGAGAVGGPVLLVARDGVPEPTWDALESLDVEEVVLIGGEAAISEAVENELDDAGYDASRVSGNDRYETAAALASDYGSEPDGEVGTFDGDRTAILASGTAFADALAAGPLAAAGHHPLLLTPPNAPHPVVSTTLESLDIERVLVIGGQSAVSAEVVTFYEAQGYEVERFDGRDRTETAITVAQNMIQRTDDFTAEGILLARGDDYPDALAASIHGAAIGAPILLTANPQVLSPATEGHLFDLCPEVSFIRALGGTSAVSEDVLNEAVLAAERCHDDEAPPAEGMGSWSELAEAPIERLNHTAVWDGSELLVWGGGGADVVANDGAAYDAATDSWRAIPEAPIEPRWAHEAVWADGQMMVYGGSAGADHLAECFADGAAYNPTLDTWGEIPTGPASGACGVGIVWDGDELIVWGGIEADTDVGPMSEPVNEGARWHPSTGEWTPIAPNPIGARSGHGAVWTGDRMIVFGGSDAQNDPRNEAAAYDPVTDEWTSLPEPPIAPRFNAVVEWTGEEVLVIGGTIDGEPQSDGAAYDPATDTWRTVPDMPGQHAQPVGDYDADRGWLFVVGGDRDTPDEPAAVAYSPATDEWHELAALPGGHRVNHTVTAVDALFVFGGQGNGTSGGYAWFPDQT